jgi:hypothetical protein
MTTRGTRPCSSHLHREEDKVLARLRRALRKAERRAGDGSTIGGTGATILKLLPPPLARLLDKGRIGDQHGVREPSAHVIDGGRAIPRDEVINAGQWFRFDVAPRSRT